jgi:hypothetical protein
MVVELTLAMLLVMGIGLGVGVAKLVPQPLRYVLIASLLATATACAFFAQWCLSATLLGVAIGCAMTYVAWSRRSKASIAIILLAGALALARLSVGPVSDREFQAALFLVFLLIVAGGAGSVGKGGKAILAATTAAGVILYAISPTINWFKIGCAGVALSVAFDLYSRRRMGKQV